MKRAFLLRIAPALIAAFAVTAASMAHGHARSIATSTWDLESGPGLAARVSARVQWRDLQRALPRLAGASPSLLRVRPELSQTVDDYLAERIALYAGEERCARVGPAAAVPLADPALYGRRWRVRCGGPGAPELRVDAFFDVLPGHMHLARARLDGGSVRERVLALDDRRFSLAEDETMEASSFLDYLWLGIEHITTGYDHLVFLLALLLVGVSLVEVATIVTGFTLAHSVTLALGVLGVVTPLPSAVEALIGLSIVVVGLENFAVSVGERTRRFIIVALAGGLVLAALGAATAARAHAQAGPPACRATRRR